MKYLVCFDGSTESQRGLSFVKSNANKSDSIVLFGAYLPVHSDSDDKIATEAPLIFVPPKDEWMAAEHERRRKVCQYRLDTARKLMVDDGFTDVSEICVEAADVREAVLAAIAKEQPFAVVLGSCGWAGVLRKGGISPTLGSLASFLSAHAPCSVIIAREHKTFELPPAIK
jgi:nucleotide-binding universal stress UspA family protein